MLGGTIYGTCFPIVTDDVTLQPPCQGIYVGVTGTVVIDDKAGNNGVTFVAVPAGTILPIAPKRVRSATTATGLIGLVG